MCLKRKYRIDHQHEIKMAFCCANKTKIVSFQLGLRYRIDSRHDRKGEIESVCERVKSPSQNQNLSTKLQIFRWLKTLSGKRLRYISHSLDVPQRTECLTCKMVWQHDDLRSNCQRAAYSTLHFCIVSLCVYCV